MVMDRSKVWELFWYRREYGVLLRDMMRTLCSRSISLSAEIETLQTEEAFAVGGVSSRFYVVSSTDDHGMS